MLVSERDAALVVADGNCVTSASTGSRTSRRRSALYQLGEASFPPLKTLHQTNLPVPPTPFVGRETGAGEVLGAARGARRRLLTLTGPGGTGKTRLALQAAAEVGRAATPHGVWWVGARRPSATRSSSCRRSARRSARRASSPSTSASGGCCCSSTTSSMCVERGAGARRLLAACPNLRPARDEPRAPSPRRRARVPGAAASSSSRRSGFFLARARRRRDSRTTARVEICSRLDDLPLRSSSRRPA